MGLGQILVAMFDRPSRAMEAVVERPRSWWLAALLIFASLAITTLLTAPMQVELANARTTEAIDRITAEMPESQAEMVRESTKPMTVPRFLLTGVGLGTVFMILGWLTRAGIIHLSSMAAGGKSVWPATFAVSVWAMLPDVLRHLVQLGCMVVNARCVEFQGLGFLVSSGDWLADSRSVLYVLAESIDPFVIWHLILLTVGIVAATKLSKGKSALMAFLVWAVLTALRLIPVAISAAFTGLI